MPRDEHFHRRSLAPPMSLSQLGICPIQLADFLGNTTTGHQLDARAAESLGRSYRIVDALRVDVRRFRVCLNFESEMFRSLQSGYAGRRERRDDVFHFN